MDNHRNSVFTQGKVPHIKPFTRCSHDFTLYRIGCSGNLWVVVELVQLLSYRSGSVRLFPFKALFVCALTAMGGTDRCSESGEGD